MVTKGLIIPTDLIEGEFDIQESQAREIVLENMVAKDDGYTYGYITLTNIKYQNYNRAYSAKAHCDITYADGRIVAYETAYSEELNSRSIYQVAVAAWNKNDSRDSTVLREYLNNTVNIAAMENGDAGCTFTTEHENDGLVNYQRAYAIAEQSYDAVTGNVTLVLEIKVANRLQVDGEKPCIPITVWIGETSIRVSVTIDGYVEGIATCSFVVNTSAVQN